MKNWKSRPSGDLLDLCEDSPHSNSLTSTHQPSKEDFWKEKWKIEVEKTNSPAARAIELGVRVKILFAFHYTLRIRGLLGCWMDPWHGSSEREKKAKKQKKQAVELNFNLRCSQRVLCEMGSNKRKAKEKWKEIQYYSHRVSNCVSIASLLHTIPAVAPAKQLLRSVWDDDKSSSKYKGTSMRESEGSEETFWTFCACSAFFWVASLFSPSDTWLCSRRSPLMNLKKKSHSSSDDLWTEKNEIRARKHKMYRQRDEHRQNDK